MDDPTSAIGRMRRRFGEPPRSFGFLERWHFHIRAPLWCRLSRDELMRIYRDQRLLREKGFIVWGAVVQANHFLFEEGRYDSPATVIYSPDLDWSDWLWPLVDLARELYGFKGWASPDPAETANTGRCWPMKGTGPWASACRNPWRREFNVRSTTVMVHRKHLPAGYLAQSYFPLLMHPQTRTTMLLPCRYWSDELLDDW